MLRLRAIGFALFYGLAPSRLYEDERHYDCSYLQHLGINLALAGRWLTFRETWEDVAFEWAVNSSRPGSWRIDASLLQRAWYAIRGRQW
jgi:hypothetical protein